MVRDLDVWTANWFSLVQGKYQGSGKCRTQFSGKFAGADFDPTGACVPIITMAGRDPPMVSVRAFERYRGFPGAGKKAGSRSY